MQKQGTLTIISYRCLLSYRYTSTHFVRSLQSMWFTRNKNHNENHPHKREANSWNASLHAGKNTSCVSNNLNIEYSLNFLQHLWNHNSIIIINILLHLQPLQININAIIYKHFPEICSFLMMMEFTQHLVSRNILFMDAGLAASYNLWQRW